MVTILTHNLGLKKICARWVPHALSKEQKDNRVRIARQLHLRWRREGESFLNRIITLGETWVRMASQALSEKVKTSKVSTKPLASKLIIIVVYDPAERILVHAIPRDQTVNAE